MSSVPASSLSVPLTQNTAPVIKFQCLFTHDVRRKAKRWQDGFLRFHTFNKRIMVYDVSSNFIGDLHWQTTADLQDGDELELEQGGVAVQVGECLEKTETDLTRLLEKKRPNAMTMASPAVDAAVQRNPISLSPQSSRWSTSGSLAQYPADRLKSLNEVLGIKRNPIGKATLPAKSPFEERHRSRDTDITETFQRPTKRQKRGPGNQNADTAEDNGTIGQSRRPRQPSAREGSHSKKLASHQPAVEQVSGQQPVPPASFQPASTVNVPSGTSSSKSRRPSNTKTSSRQQPISEAFPVDTSSNTLRFPAQKPRNKLMCMEFLSASASEKKSKQQKDTVGTHGKRDRPRSHPITNLTPIAESRSDNINHATNTKFSVLTPTDPNSSLAFIPSVSTLQALEESAAPASSQKDASISDFFKPSRPRPPPQEPGRDENAPPHPGNQREQPRSLGRSHSDTTSIIPPAPTATAGNTSSLSPNRDPPRPRSPGRSLQKSFSDVSTLRASNTVSSVGLQNRFLPVTTTTSDILSTSLDDDEEERGAWTSEALDLFDWWPPGRPKPALRG